MSTYLKPSRFQQEYIFLNSQWLIKSYLGTVSHTYSILRFGKYLLLLTDIYHSFDYYTKIYKTSADDDDALSARLYMSPRSIVSYVSATPCKEPRKSTEVYYHPMARGGEGSD